ncbi:MAG TPA: DUF1761 domain-containing protein [Chitinophagaceae bacterium]|nr:DUF1761 domain-containing protein [Chitinophagaceae bacterium]
MQIHSYVPFVAALIPLATGWFWYHPGIFGNAWMKLVNMTPEKPSPKNMLLMFAGVYLFALMIAVMLMPMVVHQFSLQSVFQGDTSRASENFMNNFLELYGDRFRTFKHGALHGTLAALFFALPFIGTAAIFEKRGFKYIAIHTGYWVLSLAIMGGYICEFL